MADILQCENSTNSLSFKQPFHLIHIPQIRFDGLQPRFIVHNLGWCDDIGRDDLYIQVEIQQKLGKLGADKA